MALNSINTNIAAIRAQENIGQANNASSSSIARLSSGERITRAADDVAALSAGTSLRTNVTTLRTALINTSQGSSLLQVADGALAQITDILQRQKAIAVQAGAGSLTSSERGFLNQEFQNLTAEIDRLAGQTNFNGVTLLDGSLFDVTNLEQNTTAATGATGSITFSGAAADIADGKLLVLNNVTIEFDSNGTVTTNAAVSVTTTAGEAVSTSIATLANTLNASTNAALSGATYTATNETLTITTRNGGIATQLYTIDDTAGNSTAANLNIVGQLTDEGGGADVYTLQGAAELGIAAGDTRGFGTIGDSIIAAQNQTSSFLTANYVNSAFNTDGTSGDIDDGDLLLFRSGNDTQITFELDFNGTLAGADAISINLANATTKEDALDAIVAAFNSYNGTRANGSVELDTYITNQLEARREGETIVFENRDVGNLAQFNGTAITAITAANLGSANVTVIGGGQFTNGANVGITTAGVSNADFVGTVQGFSATYTGATNVVDFALDVNGRTYTASGVNVTNGTTAAPQNVRFISVEGDFFDVSYVGTGVTAANQEQADLIAERLDTAFSTITFFQDREISSFTAAGDILSEGSAIGSLTGASFSLQASDFSSVRIDDVRVSAPLEGTTNGIIEFDINGVTYRSRADIGSELGQNGVFEFTSLTNANDILTFRTAGINLTDSNGNTVDSIQFDSANKAAAVQQALEDAFGIGQGGETLQFQVGVTVSDTLDISIGTVTTETIYGGATLDVLTAESAATASSVLDDAIDAVTSVRAEVGALQSRFDFASANVESSIQNQEAARGVLLDTDVAAESTAFATAQVQLQAGISVLAQANLLPQNLLKLIG